MTEAEFRQMLEEALSNYESYDDEPEVQHTRSFSDAGVLTMNEGLVVRMEDGAEFQVTIVRSR